LPRKAGPGLWTDIKLNLLKRKPHARGMSFAEPKAKAFIFTAEMKLP
jgi:hypothetical protein